MGLLILCCPILWKADRRWTSADPLRRWWWWWSWWSL